MASSREQPPKARRRSTSNGGPQIFMARDDDVQRLLQHVDVQFSPKPHRLGFVINRLTSNQLLHKPDPLLVGAERARKRAVAGRDRLIDRRRSQPSAAVPAPRKPSNPREKDCRDAIDSGSAPPVLRQWHSRRNPPTKFEPGASHGAATGIEWQAASGRLTRKSCSAGPHAAA